MLWEVVYPTNPQEAIYVLPPPCDRMDHDDPDPFTPLDQAPSDRARHVEPGHGPGALLCSNRRQCVSGPVATPQSQHRPAAVARVLLRGHGQAWTGPPSAGGRDLLCAATGLDGEPVARHPTGLGPRRHDLGHTLDGPGAQRGLARLCHPPRLDGLARHGQTCLAPGVVAHAAPGPPGGTAAVDRHRAGRSWSVGPVAVSAHHPAGVAPVFAHQHRGHVSSAGQTVPSLPLLWWGVHPTLPCKPQSNEEPRRKNEKVAVRALYVRT